MILHLLLINDRLIQSRALDVLNSLILSAPDPVVLFNDPNIFSHAIITPEEKQGQTFFPYSVTPVTLYKLFRKQWSPFRLNS